MGAFLSLFTPRRDIKTTYIDQKTHTNKPITISKKEQIEILEDLKRIFIQNTKNIDYTHQFLKDLNYSQQKNVNYTIKREFLRKYFNNIKNKQLDDEQINIILQKLNKKYGKLKNKLLIVNKANKKELNNIIRKNNDLECSKLLQSKENDINIIVDNLMLSINTFINKKITSNKDYNIKILILIKQKVIDIIKENNFDKKLLNNILQKEKENVKIKEQIKTALFSLIALNQQKCLDDNVKDLRKEFDEEIKYQKILNCELELTKEKYDKIILKYSNNNQLLSSIIKDLSKHILSELKNKQKLTVNKVNRNISFALQLKNKSNGDIQETNKIIKQYELMKNILMKNNITNNLQNNKLVDLLYDLFTLYTENVCTEILVNKIKNQIKSNEINRLLNKPPLVIFNDNKQKELFNFKNIEITNKNIDFTVHFTKHYREIIIKDNQPEKDKRRSILKNHNLFFNYKNNVFTELSLENFENKIKRQELYEQNKTKLYSLTQDLPISIGSGILSKLFKFNNNTPNIIQRISTDSINYIFVLLPDKSLYSIMFFNYEKLNTETKSGNPEIEQLFKGYYITKVNELENDDLKVYCRLYDFTDNKYIKHIEEIKSRELIKIKNTNTLLLQKYTNVLIEYLLSDTYENKAKNIKNKQLINFRNYLCKELKKYKNLISNQCTLKTSNISANSKINFTQIVLNYKIDGEPITDKTFFTQNVLDVLNKFDPNEALGTEISTNMTSKTKQNGGSKKTKSIRKHRGIYQSGPKAGKLRPGFKYTGKRTKSGLKVIAEIKK